MSEESGHILFIHVNLLAPLASPDTIPISEATILAHLQSHGFSGQILGDLADRPLRPQTLAQSLRARRPLLVGFATYQENIEKVRLWARFTKRMSPRTRIILGGPQVTFMPGEALGQMPEVDYLCRGEGEDVMLGLARALSQGTDPPLVPGVCLVKDDLAVETGPASGSKDLDTYASPYLMDLIDMTEKERAVMLTSRGCAYNCAFCYTPRASRRHVRFYSIDRIIDEMRYLKSRGTKAFWFADPNFSSSRKRLVALLEAIIRHVPGITFWCQTRYDLVTPDLLSLLSRAGADNVAYGLESANPAVLERINKSIDLAHLSEVIRLTHESGIHVELFSMFGLPGETFDQALETLNYVKKNRVAIDGNSISQQVHLFFGTPLNDNPGTYGFQPFPWTRPAYLSVCRDYQTETMSADEIRKMSLIWRVNRDDFSRDVEAGRNLFHRAQFIIQNYDALKDRPEALSLLTRIYLALEEYDAALECMGQLEKDFGGAGAVQELLNGPFLCFKIGEKKAQPGSKIIYDCRGFMDGKPAPLTWGRFQEAVLGQGMLLPEFEKHLIGMGSGEDKGFQVAFPPGYPEADLAGKTIAFQVHVHHTMEPVNVNDREDLSEPVLANRYSAQDLVELKRHNMNLYYKVVHRAHLAGKCPKEAGDRLMLINLYLKLGFVGQAERLMEKLPGNPVMLRHQAHIFRVNGYAQRALELLDKAGTEDGGGGLVRAQALFDSDRLKEAEATLGDVKGPQDIPLAEIRVGLAQRLALPLEVYLEREEMLLDARTRAML